MNSRPRSVSLLTLLFKYLSFVYGTIIHIRNLVYDWNFKCIDRFHHTIVISIGNIAAGGTGKTPFVEYILRLLQSDCNMAVVSRGYGRKTRQNRIVSSIDSAATVGDEPLQLYRKFVSIQNAPVIAVGKKRSSIISQVLDVYPQTKVILLDDGLQHRAVYRDLSIVLTTFDRPFFGDQLLPLGTLREHKEAVQRADMVLVTKCPEGLTENDKIYYRQEITKYAKRQLPIFFTYIRHLAPIAFNTMERFTTNRAIVLVTGIADTKSLLAYVSKNYQLVEHLAFSDHHAFTRYDIQKIVTAFTKVPHPHKCILTTEKDAARLIGNDISTLLQHIPIFLLPIAVDAGSESEGLNRYLINSIQLHKLPSP